MSHPPTGLKSREPRVLSDRHREAIRRLASGQRVGDVAEAMGMCRQHLSRVRRSQAGMAYAAELQQRMDESLVRVVGAKAMMKQLSGIDQRRK